MTPHLRKPRGGGASQLDSPAADAAEAAAAGGQYAETVELAGDAREGSGSSAGTGPHSESEPITEHKTESKADASGQTRAEAPLSQSDPKPVAGEVRADDLVYSVNPDGESVSLVGWCGAALEGDVAVPSEISSGGYSYAVTQIGGLDADGRVSPVFEGASPTSVSVPDSVETMLEGALSDCPSLARISVSSKNETFASFDGMLFSKDLTSLLLVPAGKEGAALLPDPADTVPAGVFSRCSRLPAVRVGEGSGTFSSRDGILYTKDMRTLVACPPGAGGAVVVPAGVEAIADGAFAGCGVASVTVLGDVREIASGAFGERTRAEAVVALPGGEGYDGRRAAWEAAGFARFAEPARPGDVSAPGSPEGEDGSGGAEASGLAYEVLEDYTLAASWAGLEEPSGELAIPAAAEVGGVSYRVSAVADAGFAGCSGLTGVELPAGLASVGERAFEACGLAELWLPASVAYVGPRALAACPSLSRVVALGATDAARDALAEDAGVSVYCPAGYEGSWNMGLPAAGNHLMPYGASLAEDPLRLEAGQSASILDGGSLLAPEPIEASYSYAAKPLSVDADGVATGKAEGSSEVSVALTLEGVELARAARAVEVTEKLNESVGVRALSSRLGSSDGAEVVDGELTYVLLDDGTLGVKATDPLTIEEALIPSKHAYPDRGSLPVTQIQASGFAGPGEDSKLTRVILPDTIKSLGDMAFQGCGTLISISLPASVEVIGKHALRNCFAMTAVDVAVGNESFSSIDGVLYDKDGTTLVRMPQGRTGAFSIPASVVSVGEAAFYGSPLTSVVLPENLQTIASDGFAQCGYLNSIVVPDSVTSIGDRAFYNNRSLESAILPKGLDVIPGDLFYDDAKLTSVVMPEAYSELGVRAFGNCASLETFSIPSSVRMVRTYALQNCTGLKALDIQTTDVEVVEKAFIGCTSLSVVAAYDALAGSGMRAAFDDAERGKVRVLLPRESASDLTYDQMAAAWGVDGFGFANVCVSGGDLPMVDKVGSAEWSFELNPDTPGLGTLVIEQTAAGTIDTLGWAGADMANVIPIKGYWSPLRNQVAKVIMRSYDGGRIHSVDTDNWFSAMGELVDAMETHVPLDVVSVDFMYNYCSKLESVPDDLSLPDTVESTAAMFRDAPLKHFPSGLATLSKNIVSVNSMFAGCKFDELPEELTLEGYEHLVDAGFFLAATKLVSLPDSFRVPRTISAQGMFQDCLQLVSLPEGFVAPTPSGTCIGGDGVSFEGTVKNMFRACPSLTYLPASFDFASLEDVDGFDELFTWRYPAPATAVETYYAGTLPASVSPDKWEKRHIRDASEGLPDGVLTIAFKLPDEQGSYQGKTWCTVLTNTEGMLSSAPKPEIRDGRAFVGWYVDEACTQKFDFAKSVTEQGGVATSPTSVLYGRYTASSGLLNTKRDGVPGQEASWALSSDGTLRIDCVDGAVIDRFGWSWNTVDTSAWAGVRDLVESIEMAPTVRVGDMGYWFEKMGNLTDITGAFVPQGCSSAYGLFYGDKKLTDVPEGFALPEGLNVAGGMFHDTDVRRLPESFTIPASVTSVNHMFRGCYHLESLPSGFRLSDKVGFAELMFSDCWNLRALPEGFVLPHRLERSYQMFQNCRSLTSLPAGFTIVGTGITSTESMFAGCASLASLPEGFSISQTVTSMDRMFSGCDKLTALPSSFDFPLDAAKGSKEPFLAQTADTLTYYAGESASVRDYPWTTQNRKLVLANDPENPLPESVHLVTFKVPDGTSTDGWSVYMISLSELGGAVTDPGDPARYGYCFQGWFADEGCEKPFAFGEAIEGDRTVYGKFSEPILRYEMPLSASVSLYADGSSSAAPLRMLSFTPEPIVVKAVASRLGQGAAALVPEEAQRTGLMANLFLGYAVSFPLDGGAVPLAVPLAASDSFYDPGSVQGSLSIDFNGAHVDYSEEGFDDVAQFTWTVGLRA